MPADPNQLNARQERFAVLYTAGPDDVQGDAKAAYKRVYGCADSSAEAGGSRLLRHDGVRARIRELREEAAEAARDRLREWWELVPEAQAIVLQAAQGEYRADDDSGRVRLQAAREILDRAMGTPKEMHRLEVAGDGLQVLVAGAAHPPQEEYEGPDGGRTVEARSREEDAEGPYAQLLQAVEEEELP